MPLAKFEPSDLSYSIIKFIKAHADDLDAVMAELGSNNVEVDRQKAREIIQFAVADADADLLARAPTSVATPNRKIDMAINDEIDRILEENVTLRKYAKADPEAQYQIPGESSIITADIAKERIEWNMKRLLEMKKALVEDKKASVSSAPDITVNMGGLVTDILDNMRKSEEEKQLTYTVTD